MDVTFFFSNFINFQKIRYVYKENIQKGIYKNLKGFFFTYL